MFKLNIQTLYVIMQVKPYTEDFYFLKINEDFLEFSAFHIKRNGFLSMFCGKHFMEICNSV